MLRVADGRVKGGLLAGEYGFYKTVKARFRSWPETFSERTSFKTNKVVPSSLDSR